MSIEVRGLTLCYPGIKTPAVSDVDLTVKTGEIVTLLGPSGSGKSTTLRCVAGLERPTVGAITIGGTSVCDRAQRHWVKPEHRKLGMVFQSYAVWPHLSVFESIAYPLRNRRLPKADIHRRVGSIAELVALSSFLDRSATQLSGGQQQRVALARALVAEPQAILFDEPLSNLDAKLRERMRREIKSLVRQTGVTALYVTHDQAEAFSISDRIAVMEVGRVCQIGTPQEIYRKPSNAYVADFVGAANIVAGVVSGGIFRIPELGLELSVAAADGEGHVAIRPEQIFLSMVQEEGSVAVRELDREYLGSHISFTIRVGKVTFQAHVSADAAPSGNTSRLWAHVSPSAPVFLGLTAEP